MRVWQTETLGLTPTNYLVKDCKLLQDGCLHTCASVICHDDWQVKDRNLVHDGCLHICASVICLDDWQVKDRKIVGERMKAHVAAPDTTPLLIFPEGTCVNNEYCVMFKRGAFDLGATVCPVAIKYNKIFVDAFWNSRRQSFTNHLVGFGPLFIVLHIKAACMLCNATHVKLLHTESANACCSRLCMLHLQALHNG